MKPKEFKPGEGKMKCKIMVILVLVSIIWCCASPGTKQVKIYQGQLETMIGKPTADMEAQFKEWGFSLMYAWQEENPSKEVIEENNQPVVNFTEAEIDQIFAEEGKYRVLYYQKKEATSDASIGTIGEYGTSYMGETAMASDRYTLARAVFKGGEFFHFKLWGNIHQTRIAGWKTIRRW
jgi:hypothetical protein